MTEESDEVDRIEQIARWLLDNHERQNRPLIKLIAQSWPDATAAELAQAWDRMIETAMGKFRKDAGPPPQWLVVEGEKDDATEED